MLLNNQIQIFFLNQFIFFKYIYNFVHYWKKFMGKKNLFFSFEQIVNKM
jgi:hypothetical protein